MRAAIKQPALMALRLPDLRWQTLRRADEAFMPSSGASLRLWQP